MAFFCERGNKGSLRQRSYLCARHCSFGLGEPRPKDFSEPTASTAMLEHHAISPICLFDDTSRHHASLQMPSCEFLAASLPPRTLSTSPIAKAQIRVNCYSLTNLMLARASSRFVILAGIQSRTFWTTAKTAPKVNPFGSCTAAMLYP